MIVGLVAGLVLAVPIILPPFLFVWYLNGVGIRSVAKKVGMWRTSQTN
jgi:hypothetical protein